MTDAPTVWYLPGPWLVVAGAGCVLLMDAAVDSPLFQAWADATTGGARTDDLLRVTAGHPAADLPSFAVVERRPDGVRVVLRGAVRVWCADGRELTSGGSEPWSDGVVAPDALPARVAGPAVVGGPRLPLAVGAAFGAAVDLYAEAPGTEVPVPTGTGAAPAETIPSGESWAVAAAPDAALPAAALPAVAPRPGDGVIDAFPWAPGGAPPDPAPLNPAPLNPATLNPATLNPAPVPAGVSAPWTPPPATIDDIVASPTTPVGEAWTAAQDAAAQDGAPADAAPADAVEMSDVTVARSTLTPSGPTVVAVRCPAGHPTPVHTRTCRVCDLPVGPDQAPETVARPTLGVLRLPGRQAIPLDRGVVFGRAPSARDTPAGERQHVVSLASPGKDVSRNHLEIRLDGWHVLAVDLDSVNGTVVVLPGRPPQRLRPDEPVQLERGSTLTLADEVTITFEVPA